jgi:hypothetical protein
VISCSKISNIKGIKNWIITNAMKTMNGNVKRNKYLPGLKVFLHELRINENMKKTLYGADGTHDLNQVIINSITNFRTNQYHVAPYGIH